MWFHSETTNQDADNIVKPILDGLKGAVYEDDFGVTTCSVTRVDLRQPYFLRGNVPSSLLTELEKSPPHLVWIEITALDELVLMF